jgi:RHS repeat-associated protein
MLGSSNVVATSTGALENESDFYPFGGEDPITQNLTNQKFKFTGKERDPETGLDDFEARYYNSNMGRFQSPDWANKQEPVPYAKLWNPQTLNLYAYVGNNPESSPDLDGHEGPDPDPDPFGASVSSDIFADPASSGPAPSQGTVGAPILQSGQQTQKQSTDQTQQAQQQKYDPSKTGPEDPTNPGHPLSQNSIVKKASDKAFMQTTNGQAGNGLAEAGFSIEYKDGKLSTANWTSSVNADGTLNQLSIKTDDNTIAILHTHGNKAIPTPSLPDKSRGTPGDVASRFPNFVRSASHLYVTVPGTTTWTDLGNP